MSAVEPREHVYVNGVCRCLGKCVTHNERGQVYVFQTPTCEEQIDYFSDVDDYLEDDIKKRHTVAATNLENKQ